MGILNITPDSFSDGGSFPTAEHAVAHARTMVAQGADIIDVGGESTRPGAEPVDAAEQCRRVIPVVARLRGVLPGTVHVSVDTTNASVAAAAIEAGATMINDTSAGRDDPEMFALAASSQALLVLMHRQGVPKTMQDHPHYTDVVAEVREFLIERAALAERAGVGRGQLILDPGIGFGKQRHHNIALLGRLRVFVDTGYPILLGVSRKRFMGTLVPQTDPTDLVAATCAVTALGVAAGVRYFRVHDIGVNRQAADISWAVSSLPEAPGR